MQVADSPRFDMGAMYLGRHYRCFPGQGTFPVIEFMQAVHATGYSSYISHEVFSDEFRAALLDATAEDGKRSLVWLENSVKDDKNTEAGKSLHVQPSIPNPQSQVKDIEFIEIKPKM